MAEQSISPVTWGISATASAVREVALYFLTGLGLAIRVHPKI
jgi:hypothetical protein